MSLRHLHLPTVLIGAVLLGLMLGVSTLSVKAQTSEHLPLDAGCNSVVLTWPSGVMMHELVAAITPAESLEAIWLPDPGTGTYLSYAPDAPQRVGGLRTAGYLDTVQICMETPGVLTRPLG